MENCYLCRYDNKCDEGGKKLFCNLFMSLPKKPNFGTSEEEEIPKAILVPSINPSVKRIEEALLVYGEATTND